MAVAALILFVLLMIPFLGWGIYTLRERFVLHEEIPHRVEVATLCGVMLFCFLQLVLVKQWTGAMGALYIFTGLGLMVASTALFGPMLVSVAARLVVDFIHPQTEGHADVPHFAPAEALEEGGDLEGALREYMVMARIFPRDAETAFRTGHALAELGRHEDATSAFERGLSISSHAERALMITNRLADIYLRDLDRETDARRVLSEYIERYPEGNRVQLVRDKLERMSKSAAPAASESANGLPDSPQGDPSG